HLVRCLYCKGQRQTAADHSVSREGHRLRPAVSPRPVPLQDQQESMQDHRRSFPSRSPPIPKTTIWQKVPGYKDQNLAPPEQFFPHGSGANKQDPCITLTLRLPIPMHNYVLLFNILYLSFILVFAILLLCYVFYVLCTNHQDNFLYM